jgi:hypothetical protein
MNNFKAYKHEVALFCASQSLKQLSAMTGNSCEPQIQITTESLKFFNLKDKYSMLMKKVEDLLFGLE